MVKKFKYKMKVAKSMAQKGKITVPTKMPEVEKYTSTLYFNFTTCIKQHPRKQCDLLLQPHYSRRKVS